MTWLGLARVATEPAPAMLQARMPLSQHARVSFSLRGTCDTCARTNVACAARRAATYSVGTVRTMVCADCVMTGKAVL